MSAPSQRGGDEYNEEGRILTARDQNFDGGPSPAGLLAASPGGASQRLPTWVLKKATMRFAESDYAAATV